MFLYVMILALYWPGLTFSTLDNFTTKLSKPKSPFAINESNTDFKITMEANSFACGNQGFCDSSYSRYDSGTTCLTCKPCQCDDLCHEFRDCCADKNGTRFQVTRSWTCVKRMVKPFRFSTFAYMVSSCGDRENAVKDPDTVKKCVDPVESNTEEVRPVTDPATNVTFRNRFCAECNDVDHFDKWTFHVECVHGAINSKVNSKEELWKKVLESSGCVIQDIPPIWTPVRECHAEYIQTCDRESLGYSYNVERLCLSSYGSPVIVRNAGPDVYLNLFCVLCNGLNPRHRCKARRIGGGGGGQYKIPSLDVVIDFNPRSEVLNRRDPPQYSNDVGCPRNETFDPFTEECKPIKCPPRRFLSNCACLPIFTAKGMGYELVLVFRFSENLNASFVRNFTAMYTLNLRQKLQRYKPFGEFHVEYRRVQALEGDSQENVFGDTEGMVVNLTLVSRANDAMEDVERDLRELDKYSVELMLDNKTVHLYAIAIRCPASLGEYIGGTIEQFPFEIESQQNECTRTACTTEYIDVFHALDCPYIELNLSDFNHSYIFENNTLFVRNNSIVLNKSSHIYCDGILQLCTNILPDIQKQLALLQNVAGNRTLGIVSVVCISLSLVSLFVTFVIFCIIPQLRTVPGKNTMALMFHLFCAQLLFQTGINATYSKTLCRAMGILIHYFWLSTFNWMAVNAYHMCATFSNLSLAIVSTDKEQIKILLKYTFVCTLIACTVIGCYIGYHLGTSDMQNVGYGGRFCFLQEPRDIGIFFAAPLGLILLFNTVCFTKTIISIRAVPDMGSVKNRVNKTHTVIYFRLSVLLGFTWIFGFVASALQSELLRYIFVILTGLQGVFIFLAFCGSKRTLGMIKQKLDICIRPLPQSTSTYQTHSTSL